MIPMINRGRIADPAVTEEFDYFSRRISSALSVLVDPETGESLADMDYGEDTWRPSLGGNTTYTERRGVWTKKGRIVVCHGYLNVNVLGTGSTGTITGLPFRPAKVGLMGYAGTVGFFGNAASNFTSVGIRADASSNSALMTGISAAGPTMALPAVFFGNSTIVHFTLMYPVEATAV